MRLPRDARPARAGTSTMRTRHDVVRSSRAVEPFDRRHRSDSLAAGTEKRHTRMVIAAPIPAHNPGGSGHQLLTSTHRVSVGGAGFDLPGGDPQCGVSETQQSSAERHGDHEEP